MKKYENLKILQPVKNKKYVRAYIIYIVKISATRGKSLREIVNINVHNPSINNLTLPSEKKYVCFNAVQKWDINLQDVVTLYQYQNCSSKMGICCIHITHTNIHMIPLHKQSNPAISSKVSYFSKQSPSKSVSIILTLFGLLNQNKS